MYFHSLSDLSTNAGTIIVPNAPCARVLSAALDQLERQQGAPTWRTPDIVAWSTYLMREFEALFLTSESSDDSDVEFVLSVDQERAVWEAVISQDPGVQLLSPDQTAALAQTAWHTLHAWCLSTDAVLNGAVSDDVAAFGRWSQAYLERTAELRVSDQARLMALRAMRNGTREDTLRAHGFLEAAPALQQWFETRGIEPMRIPEHADGEPIFNCRAFPDREAELYAAMQWAAAIGARDPRARVVLAVDGLNTDQYLIRRCVTDVLNQTDAGLNGDQVYFGADEPLLHHPPIRAALDILEFSFVLPWDKFSALIRNPCIVGAESERFERALFDEEVRALDRYELPAPFVANFLADSAYPCKQFARVLSELTRLEQEAPRRQRLVQWLDHFDRALSAAGWPGDGDLTSRTAMTLRRWGDACDRLNRLDAVLGPVSKGEAVQRLRRVLTESTGRELPADPRVFVATAEQALVLQPTHLWLAGASRDAFVTHGQPSPFLPFELQRASGIPGADAKRDLHRARRLINSMTAAAGECVASYCIADGDLVIKPSPLIAGLGDAKLETARRYVPDSWRQARMQASFSTVVDSRGPALPKQTPLRGGVANLAAQAACPFQAFARHRLTATAVAEPRPGIDMRRKGQVIHRTLAAVWQRVGNSRALAALAGDERRHLIREAITKNFAPVPFETELEGSLRFVERDRLVTLLDSWLEFECSRPPFTVVAVEEPATVVFEDLELRIRVDRIDRMDDDQKIVIDYKTGQCRSADWLVPRMNQPQLPFYALTFPTEQTNAIAFAKVDRAEPKWIQVPSEKSAAEQPWSAQCEDWRADLATLAAGIRDGDARLDPKLGSQTCRLCEMQVLCRIAELGVAQDFDGASDD